MKPTSLTKWPDKERAVRQAGCWLGIILALAIFSISFIGQIQKNPLRLDEVKYFQCIKNLVHLGTPLYDGGQVNLDPRQLIHLSTRQLGGELYDFYRFKPETGIVKEAFFALTANNEHYIYGMWHPPLYIYVDALLFRLFPLTPATSADLRYFNLVFAAAMFAGMAALARELYGRRGLAATALAIGLYALNSLAVRGTLLIDYNATLGPCAAVWMAWAYARTQRRQIYNGELAVTTALVFYASLGIGACMVAGTLLHAVLWSARRREASRLWPIAGAMALGMVAFLVSFLVFCRVAGLPFTQPFLHNLQRLSAGPGLTPHSLRDWLLVLITYLGFFGREIGYTTLLAAGSLALTQIYRRDLLQSPGRSFLPLMAGMSLVSFAALRGDAYGFPKYILFALPLMFVWLAGDSLELIGAGDHLAWPRRELTVTALAAIGLISGAHSWTVMHASGSTIFNSGEQGVVAAARSLHNATTPDEIVLSDIDVAFLAGRQYVAWTLPLLTDIEKLQARVAEAHIKHAVISTAMLNATTPEVKAYIRQQFTEKSRDADFVLIQDQPTPRHDVAPARADYGRNVKGMYSPEEPTNTLPEITLSASLVSDTLAPESTVTQ
jgi:hypothetical protein